MSRMSVKTVLDILELEYPVLESDLDFTNNFELLVAVLLSAQTTDKAVNKVTPALFHDYPDAKHMARATPVALEPYIKTIGLYRSKAKHLVETARILDVEYNGVVPSSFDALVSLPGVGRKTANVVRAVGFDIPAIAVDTHVERVAKRLGWAPTDATVLEVEEALMKKIPKHRWAKAHHALLFFGRYYSTARNHEDVYKLLKAIKEKHNETLHES